MKYIVILFAFIPAFLFSQIPSPKPNTYVNDFAGKLTDQQIQALNEKISAIEKKSSVQIAVVLINELPDNMVIEDYARQIGQQWHVGNAQNGIVYVAAINNRKQRIETAKRIEGDIPDMVALQIQDGIKPYFRSGDYFGGLNELLDGINKRVDPVAKEQMALAEKERQLKNEKALAAFLVFFGWTLGIGATGFGVWFIFFRPAWLRKRKEQEEEAQRKEKERWDEYTRSLQRRSSSFGAGVVTGAAIASVPSHRSSSPSSDSSYSSPSRSSSSDSSSSSSSSYGDWGSGSSSSDSGFSGGGSSSDW